jgi:hypothetical protein
MRVRLIDVEVDEPLGAMGGSHRLRIDSVHTPDFWIYRVGGPRSRTWTLKEPARRPSRATAIAKAEVE